LTASVPVAYNGRKQRRGVPTTPSTDPSATGAEPAASHVHGPLGPLADLSPIGGPTSSSWREQALTRIAELEEQAAWMGTQAADGPPAANLQRAIARPLAAARTAAEGEQRRRPLTRFMRWLSGAPLERSASNIDAAEAHMLRLATPEYVRGHLPSLVSHVRQHLGPADPRRVELERIALPASTVQNGMPQPDVDRERDAIVAAVRGASSAARREVVRVRSFRSVLLVATTLLALAGAGLVVLGALSPNTVVLCFNPTGGGAQGRIVCPTAESPVSAQRPTGGAGGSGGASEQEQVDIDETITNTTSSWDVPLVELVGLIAAAVASAASLRRIRGTTTPHGLPVALALLKLPLGALTAVVGLILMRGQFIPGLSALDSSGQILAWAVIFGYSQEVFTRFVDQRGHDVLNQVGMGGRQEQGGGAAAAVRPYGGEL
jgi:hypothetical protein